MPLSSKGETIKAALQKEYGKERGERILYAGKNKGTFTGIDALADSLQAVADDIESINRRIDAYCVERADELRGKGRADATRKAEHRLTMDYNGDFNMVKFIQHLHRLGAVGASRSIVAYDEDDKKVPFEFDGDGADKIISAEIDGEDILK